MAERIYRLLLKAFPASLRARFGGDMERLFAERRREAQRSGSGFRRAAAVLGLWLRAFRDVAVHATLARLQARQPLPGRAATAGARHRRLRGSGVGDLRDQVRQAVRSLGRTPAFTAVTVLTLALAIAANSVIFSVVNGVLLRPLPYPDADRLVRLYHEAPGLQLPVDDLGMSDTTYFHFRDQRLLEDLALYQEAAVNLSGGGTPERVLAASVSHSLFDTLGIPPARGRTFNENDERPGAPPVVILADGLWRQQFAARDRAVGETLLIDDVAHEIAGVMPPGVDFPRPETALWIPMRLDPANTKLDNLGVGSVARIPAGSSIADTEARLDHSLENIGEIFPIRQGSQILQDAGFTTRARGLRDQLVGDVRSSLWFLMGMVGFVFLIACANLANLFLVRAEGRERETALRLALGAGRFRLLAALLIESLVLGIAAGGAALVIAQAGLSALLRFGPRNVPRLHEISLDAAGFAFIFALAAVAGLLLGLVPAGRLRAEVAPALKQGVRGATSHRDPHRMRSVLVASQVALGFILLVGSGLMVRSFMSLSHVDPGFAPQGVLAFDVALTARRYPGDESPAAFVQRVLDALAALPGVDAVGGVSSLPLAAGASVNGVLIEDDPEEPGELPKIHAYKIASPGYYETMRIPLLAGRTFVATDHQRRSGAAIVNRAFAQRYWPGESAVGKRLQPRWTGTPDQEHWLTVVGVVGDVHDAHLEDGPTELIYYPLVSNAPEPVRDAVRALSFVVRTEGATAGLAEPIRQAVRRLDAGLPVANMQPVAALVARARSRTAFTMTLLLIGAAGALLIGTVGIFGVISRVVGQRTVEIGVRMALGARASQIGVMVLGRSLCVVLAGIAAGALGAAALTGSMRALLFEISPLDPSTYFVVAGVLIAVAVLASWLPARRAARIQPLEALRGN